MSLKNKTPYLLIMLAIIAVDQATKQLVTKSLSLENTRDIIKGFLRLWHVRNSGAIWGFFSGHDGGIIPRVITVLAVAALLIVAWFFLRADAGRGARLELFSYAFILGGALGNIIDRLRLGYVVDFLDVYVKSWHWPTFNAADSCITIGVLLLAFSLLRGERRNPCTPS